MRRQWLRVAIGLAGLIVMAQLVTAQQPIREGFESSEPTWIDAGGDTLYALDRSRVQGAAHSGDWCEQIRVRSERGNFVHIAHPVRPARIINELEATVWVRADRPGVQLLGRVVLPSTVDPRSGQPLETLIAGDQYAQAGTWQQLTLPAPQDLLKRRQTALQVQVGTQTTVDLTGAYLAGLVLNVYTGPGEATVWTDDLDLGGFVAAQASAPSPIRTASNEVEVVRPVRPVEFNHGTLMVEGVPRLVRAIEFNGEPLNFLADLGFDAVVVKEAPPAAFLEEARRTGLGVISPPPFPRGWEQRRLRLPPLDATWDPVWVWHLGYDQRTTDLERTEMQADLIRQMDRRLSRPLMAGPDEALDKYRRRVDVLVDRATSAFGSLSPADATARLQAHGRITGPTTPFWATIATHPPAALLEQIELTGGSLPLASSCLPDHLWMQIHAALSAGSHGLIFKSERPLDRDDPATRLRADSLRLVNEELGLIAPWLADGEIVARPTADQAGVDAVLVKSGRVQLLLVAWSGSYGGIVPGQGANRPIRFVLPGVPDSNDAFEVSPAGLAPLERRRVSGGTEVVLPRLEMRATLLMAQDVEALTRLRTRLQESTAASTRLARNILFERLRGVTEVSAEVRPPQNTAPPERWLEASRGRLQQAEAAMNRNEQGRAYQLLREGHLPLRTLARVTWTDAVSGLDTPLITPMSASYWSLADHTKLVDRLKKASLGPNRLPGGDCEAFQALVTSGWAQQTAAPENVSTDVILTEETAYQGDGALCLIARPRENESPDDIAWLEAPLVALSTAEISVRKGQMVRIEGWVHIPQAITHSVEGVRVWDSIGGTELAIHMGTTTAWKRFRYFRVAPRDMSLQLNVELTGLGVAFLDDLSVRVVQFPEGEELVPAPETLPAPTQPRLPEAVPAPPLDGPILPTEAPDGGLMPPGNLSPLPLPEPIEGAGLLPGVRR